MLVLVTVFWGLSFVLMKDWQDQAKDCPAGPLVAGLTLIPVRMVPSLLLLALASPRAFRGPARAHAVGAVVGLAFAGGFVLQVWGLTDTTPARSAFFTAISSAWVPPVAWLIFRQRPALHVWPGLLIAIMGLGLLTADVQGAAGFTPNFNRGDWLTLGCSFFFVMQVLLLDRLGRTVEPAQITPAFLTVTGVLALGLAAALAAAGPGLGPWLRWTADALTRPGQWWRLALLVVFCTTLAFHWMNSYQPRVTALRAAMIYLLEPVFATLISVLAGFDRVGVNLLAGGALVLAGIMVVERPWASTRTLPES